MCPPNPQHRPGGSFSASRWPVWLGYEICTRILVYTFVKVLGADTLYKMGPRKSSGEPLSFSLNFLPGLV